MLRLLLLLLLSNITPGVCNHHFVCDRQPPAPQHNTSTDADPHKGIINN
jgi:hypothetical protein